MIKISKLAKDLNVTKATLWNWRREGKISFLKVGGLNYVSLDDYNTLLGIKQVNEQKVVIYCRVSSSENKTNLESQRDRLISYCNAKGYAVSKIVTEIGSGVNDSRPKLEKLLKDLDFTLLVVEHKDRLTRFGFNYIETLLNKNNIKIEVVNPVIDEKDDIVQDFVSIITSFCARIYGHRRSKRRTEQMVKELTGQELDVD